MVTLEKVRQFVSSVSSEDIGRAHKCIADGTSYYLVENSRGDLDEDGEVIEYRVSWTRKTKFTCSCYAGKEAFIHCKKGFCQHVLIAVAAAQEEKQAMAELAQAQAAEAIKEVEQVAEKLFIGNREATDEEYARVMCAKPAKVSKSKSTYNPKPFSLMR